MRPIRWLLIAGLALMLLASVGLAYIGSNPRKKYAVGDERELHVGSLIGGLAISSLWLIPIALVIRRRQRLWISDRSITLKERGRTVAIAFNEVTVARVTNPKVGQLFGLLGDAADERVYRIESDSGVIVVEGPLARACGDDFEAAWARCEEALADPEVEA